MTTCARKRCARVHRKPGGYCSRNCAVLDLKEKQEEQRAAAREAEESGEDA